MCGSEIVHDFLLDFDGTIEALEAVRTVLHRPSSVWGGAADANYYADYILLGHVDSSSYCNFLNVADHYEEWRACDNTTSYRFLCNDCNGVITKYAMIPINSSQHDESGSALCTEWYGSPLSSIHSDRDQAEVQKIWNISTTTSSMWIGLEHHTATGFTWTDGTEYDYGSEYIESTADNAIDADAECTTFIGGRWFETECHWGSYPLCSVPSELSLELSNWTVIQSGSVLPATFDFVQNAADTLDVVIADKQWFNGEGPLLIEYTLSIDFNGAVNVSSALMLFNGAGGSWCDFYWIAIQRGGDGFYFLVLYDDSGFALTWTTLPVIWDDDAFYVLSIEVTDGTHFKVTFNDDDAAVMVYNDTANAPNVLSNGYSGFIGLYADSGIQTTPKSLYVSGTPLNTERLNFTDHCPWYPPPTGLPTESPTLSVDDGVDDDDDTDDSAESVDAESGLSVLITDNVIIAAILGLVIMCCVGALVFICTVWLCATMKYKYKSAAKSPTIRSLKSPSSGMMKASPSNTAGPGHEKLDRMITPKELKLEPGLMSTDGDWVTIGYIGDHSEENIAGTEDTRNGKESDSEDDSMAENEEEDKIMELPMINSREAKRPHIGQGVTSSESLYTRRATFPEGHSEGQTTRGGPTPFGPDNMV